MKQNTDRFATIAGSLIAALLGVCALFLGVCASLAKATVSTQSIPLLI